MWARPPLSLRLFLARINRTCASVASGPGQLNARTCTVMLRRESGPPLAATLMQLAGAHFLGRKFHYFYSKFYGSARNKLEFGEIYASWH